MKKSHIFVKTGGGLNFFFKIWDEKEGPLFVFTNVDEFNLMYS